MNKYELTVIFKPNLDEETKNLEIQQIKEFIIKFGGNIEKFDDWGKRKLAYEIQKFNEGFYIFIIFEGDSKIPLEIESRVRIRENIIRYLIIRQDD